MGSKKRASVDSNENRAKRTKSPENPVTDGQISDPQSGRTCHQCRHKALGVPASCMNKKGDKQCSIKLCRKCLLNRYGEKVEEVVLLESWSCPKCRGLCNCSICMKKKGLKPTGLLVYAAKATGFSSVSDLLLNGSECLNLVNKTNMQASVNKESVISPRKKGKENSLNGIDESNFNLQNQTSHSNKKKLKESKHNELKGMCNGNKVEVKCSNESSPTKFGSEETSQKLADAKGKDESLPSKKKGSKKGTSKHTASDASQNISLCHKDAMKLDSVKEEETDCSKEEKDLDIHKYAKTSEEAINKETKVKNKMLSKSKKKMKCFMDIQNEEFRTSISLPPGSRLTTVADIELTSEDVGHALQFLEFCATFGKTLNLNKGYAESVLKDLMRERTLRRGRMHDSLTVRFLIQLLSLILKDMDEESEISSPTNNKSSWLPALKKCISLSPFKLNDLKPDYFDGGDSCYDDLDFSKKLRLLTYLCDEALNTTKLRNWIENQHSNFMGEQKEIKGQLAALKDKEKQAKSNLQGELAKALMAKNGLPLSIAEHDAVVLQIKKNVAEAQSERLLTLEMASKKRQRSVATRTAPIVLDVNGRAFWKLRSLGGEGNILLQDMESWESVKPSEKWSIYKDEQKQEIEKYISFCRLKMQWK